MESDLRFEAALEQLEQVVAELEGGALGLDDALAAYERGVRLLKHCHGLLDGAERRVALLTGIDADGQAITVPFDALLDGQPRAGDEPIAP
ncbi:MAG: exodeoxyribonuclease VII small subunit [Isosphaeraceae bacterium]|nr:exodeoxyribonuclease VII small subunit [Isosphaeraceae bacterium]